MEGSGHDPEGSTGVKRSQEIKDMVQVKNVRTGVVSPMELDQWNNVKNDRRWAGVFVALEAEEPKEVKELKESKRGKPKSESKED